VFGVLAKVSDLMLHVLVPNTVADAGCVTDPYDYWGSYCYCEFGYWLRERCHVYSNCTISCVCRRYSPSC
jgi:hypothetical protein